MVIGRQYHLRIGEEEKVYPFAASSSRSSRNIDLSVVNDRIAIEIMHGLRSGRAKVDDR